MRLKALMLSLTLVGAMAMPLLYAAPAQAQATRTWVSGVGDDANPCSRTAPCKTWAGAISKTTAGGEIDALDPGGFGQVTITKSMTIDGGGGIVASIVASLGNGIVVQAGATDIVIIKNVRFQGLRGGGNANAGTNAIRFTAGLRLVVENCEIYGFNTNGIDIANATANNTTAINNTQIMNIGNAGVLVESTVASLVEIDDSRVYNGGSFGVAVTNGNKAALNRSVFNFSGQGVHADTGGTLILNNNAINFNNTGISGTGTFQSFANNALMGNNSDGVTPTKIGAQSDPFGLK